MVTFQTFMHTKPMSWNCHHVTIPAGPGLSKLVSKHFPKLSSHVCLFPVATATMKPHLPEAAHIHLAALMHAGLSVFIK